LVAAAVLLPCRLCAADGGESTLLRNLRKGHPRLLLLEEDAPRIRKAIKEDPVIGQWYEQVKGQAGELLGQKPMEYAMDPRGHALGACRQALDRILTLGLVYRVEGGEQYAARAVEEMLAAAARDSWNPKHFLDVAELTNALAIGYDWFHDKLSPEQQKTIREAIVKKGLSESLPFYNTAFYWASCNHNWNQVCNGGMMVGALAVADEEPELAEKIVSAALKSIRASMKEFGDDGGWAEGPGYWRYATEYAVFFTAALESALGEDAARPMLDNKGFANAGEFCIHVTGPFGKTFNFADAGDHAGGAPQMFWMGQKFGKPAYSWFAQKYGWAAPCNILWRSEPGKSPKELGMKLDAFFPHSNVVCMRSAWEDENAVFIGFKGGDNKTNHGHLDLGGFVLDADGRRWALDLGGDDYGLPGYFAYGKPKYYRLNTHGHNTFVINGKVQSQDGVAPIVAFQSKPELAFAVADLTHGYRQQAKSLMRGIFLIGRRNVLIQDELELPKESSIVWQMHTRAKIMLGGSQAMLTLDGKRLCAEIVEPAGAKFERVPASAPKPEAQQPDVSKLTLSLKLPPGKHRIIVQLCPDKRESPGKPKSLSEWIGKAEVKSGSR